MEHKRTYKILSRRNGILFLLPVIVCILFAGSTKAGNIPGEPVYDEILVFVNVQNVGGEEVQALIRDQNVYLDVHAVFDFLKIKNTLSQDGDSVTGFFIDQKAVFIIDRINRTVYYQDKTWDLNGDDIIKTENGFYLKSDYFGKIFGLDCTFNFRSLTVVLKSKTELPAVREMRLEQIRGNINKLKGEYDADTVIGRKHSFFHLGSADWAVNSTQITDGTGFTRMNLSIGSGLLGGEFNGMAVYTTGQPFLEKQQYYLWRYANNDLHTLRQAMAGKIPFQSISSIYEPVVGAQITNSPTYCRKSFGTYTISNYTHPEWTVELYVNNVLVDYVKADVSGFFTFNVPLIYGNTDIVLRYYGPWGEEEISTQNITVPYTFIPVNELEYKFTAGVVEDTLQSIYSQGKINYGLTGNITVGGGAEYLSSVSENTAMPFLNISMRPARNMLFTGEYVYGVRSKGILSYHLPSDLHIELNYTRYEVMQEAVVNNYNEERKFALSMPFRFKNITGFSRLSANQNVYEQTKFSNGEFLFSAGCRGFNLNITTLGYLVENSDPYVYSNASLSVALPRGFIFTPRVRYEYNKHEFLSMHYTLEKRVFRQGALNASFEKNFTDGSEYYQFGFKYDFSFSHFAFSVNKNDRLSSVTESASGSLLYENSTRTLDLSGSTNGDRGGIMIIPFLDLNNNGKFDKSEPKVDGLNVRTNGGGIKETRSDTTIMITGIEPYTNYFIALDGNNFENIAWQLNKKSYTIAVDPNLLKVIEIPVTPAGEVSGYVYIEEGSAKTGAGPVKITFYRAEKVVASVFTETDGYFDYLGLAPGVYTARIDLDQADKMDVMIYTRIFSFEIKCTAEGDIVNEIDFTLKKIPGDLDQTVGK